jgi:Immunoglobulin-like domain of bacterial spore germination
MFARRAIALAALLVAVALTSCSSGPGPSLPTSSTGAPPASPTPTASGPAIVIEEPTEGETVTVPFTVSGEANTFEAALTVDVVDASGEGVCIREIMATSGSGTPGTWEGTLAFPPEMNPLRVTLRAYALSAKDGSMTDLVEVPITIATDRPPIILTSPACGQVYESGSLVIVTGTAALFEAALTVDVRDASGATVVSLPVVADACCVESNFSSRLTLPDDIAPGLYEVVAFSLSPKDGSVENEFPVQIEIRG